MANIQAKINNLLKYKELLKQLVLKDVKLKYRRSYLGYIWSILNPLLMMMVLVVVFSNLFRHNVPNFPVYLISGQILFAFLSESTQASVTSIISNAPLLKKTYVPKYIFTLAKVSSSLVNLMFSMIALVLVMIITKTIVTWNILLFPIVILEVYLFSLGLGLILASITVFFRDIQYLWGVFLSIWMYLSPIIYPVSIIPDSYQWFYTHLNPMYSYIQQFREVILYGEPFSWGVFNQGILIAFAMLFVGLWIFNRKQDQFILYI